MDSFHSCFPAQVVIPQLVVGESEYGLVEVVVVAMDLESPVVVMIPVLVASMCKFANLRFWLETHVL